MGFLSNFKYYTVGALPYYRKELNCTLDFQVECSQNTDVLKISEIYSEVIK